MYFILSEHFCFFIMISLSHYKMAPKSSSFYLPSAFSRIDIFYPMFLSIVKFISPKTCTISFFHGFSSLELVLFQYNFAYPKKMYCLVYIWWDPKDLEKRENDYAMSISFSPTLQFVFLISSCFLLPCVFFISFILCL